MGHPSVDADARRRFLKKLIPKILDEENRKVTLARLSWLVNCVTAPHGYPCKKRKEYHVDRGEVKTVADDLAAIYAIEKDAKRRKRDPKKDWPERYRKGNLLAQLAFAALDDEKKKFLG